MTQFGSHLQGLTQQEKYELITAIGLHLWGSVEPVELDDEFNELDDLFEEEPEPDLIMGVTSNVVPQISANTMSALVILQYESPESLSFLLPAICEYARDDDR
jgi:hypothetical protein